MKYVYLLSTIAGQTELNPNDVGIVSLEGNTTLRVTFLKSGTVLDVDKALVEDFEIELTGDRYSHKVCDRCFRRLETSIWYENNRHKKDNVITKRPSCRDCRKLKNGRSIATAEKLMWASKKPESFSYFTCPICLKSTIAGITKVVLDHNHTTGKVRGWLCESCNTGIGRFDDDPAMLKRAVEWLENN